jgi:hypothetical protein
MTSFAPVPRQDRSTPRAQAGLYRTVTTKELTLQLREDVVEGNPATATPDAMVTGAAPTPKPLTVPSAAPVNGIVYVPAHNTPMKPGSRENLLVAIAKARRWFKEVAQGQSFAEIPGREGKTERHVRRQRL